MSPKIRAVYFKELRDALRDRRTVFATVVIPLVLYPVMLLGLTEVTQMAQTKLEREHHLIAIPANTKSFFEDTLNKLPAEEKAEETTNLPSGAKTTIKKVIGEKKPVINALEYVEMPLDASEKALAAGTVRAIVVMDDHFADEVKALKQVKLDVKYDQAEQRSNDAASRVHALFERYRKIVINQRLESSGLGHETLEPFSINITNVAQPTKVGGSVLGSFLPLLFIMMIITGAIHPAIDMTAGEKERSTLETLISFPVKPIEIITGKFLAVATMALGNAALNVGSFAFTFSMMPKMGDFGFPWAALPLTLLLLLPLALFFSGLLLAVASIAANQKEAQIYCLPIYLVPVLGMMVVMMPGIELEGPLLLAPVLNTALLIKQLFLSHGTAQQIAFVFISTCLYAAGAVAFAARIFAREEVLFSAQGSLRLFLNRKFFKRAATPTPGDALVFAALLYPINFYVQLYLQTALLVDKESGFTSVAFAISAGLPIWLLFGALPIAVAAYLKADLKTTFLWRMPAPRAIAGGVLLAAGGWLIAQEMVAIQSRFWEYPFAEMDVLSKFLHDKAQTVSGMIFLVFFVGITPGICEEHFFRGYLQQGITRKDKWFSLLTVGLIFGAFHSPFWKLPITASMGVVLAYVAWETASIWPGVIFHTLYNSMSVVLPTLLGLGDEKPVPGKGPSDIPLQYLLPSIALFVAGILLVRGTRPKTEVKPTLPAAPEIPTARPLIANITAAGEHA